MYHHLSFLGDFRKYLTEPDYSNHIFFMLFTYQIVSCQVLNLRLAYNGRFNRGFDGSHHREHGVWLVRHSVTLKNPGFLLLFFWCFPPSNYGIRIQKNCGESALVGF